MKKILSIILAFALVFSLSACKSSNATYTVGICEFTQHSAQSEVVRGFTDYLKEKLGDKVDFNIQNAANDASIATTIINTFVSDNVDLILADNTQSLQIASATTGDIPILGAAITDYTAALNASTDGINVSGTSDLAPLDLQAEMILELFPGAKNVGLIYCSSEANSLYQINKVQEYLSEKGIVSREFPCVDTNDLVSVVSAACEYSDVIYLPTDNTIASSAELVDSICRSAGIPVIAGEEGLCKTCGVATLSIDYYELGKQTGMMAYNLLIGEESISDMPIETAESSIKMYNAEICEYYGITPPDGYIAIN